MHFSHDSSTMCMSAGDVENEIAIVSVLLFGYLCTIRSSAYVVFNSSYRK